MSVFVNLFNHNDEYVRETAILLAEIEELFVNYDIDESEFNELADDVLQLADVIEITDNIERRSHLLQAAKTFKNIISTITRGS